MTTHRESLHSDRDPVCVLHGKRRSGHECLYCCLCFRDLTPDECHTLPDGSREDVCDECAEEERKVLAERCAKAGCSRKRTPGYLLCAECAAAGGNV